MLIRLDGLVQRKAGQAHQILFSIAKTRNAEGLLYALQCLLRRADIERGNSPNRPDNEIKDGFIKIDSFKPIDIVPTLFARQCGHNR